MLRLIATPDVQIIAVCDPVKDGTNYMDWDNNGIRDSVRRKFADPNWGADVNGIRAGRTMAKEIHRNLLRQEARRENFNGVAVTRISANCWKKRRTSTPSRS